MLTGDQWHPVTVPSPCWSGRENPLEDEIWEFSRILRKGISPLTKEGNTVEYVNLFQLFLWKLSDIPYESSIPKRWSRDFLQSSVTLVNNINWRHSIAPSFQILVDLPGIVLFIPNYSKQIIQNDVLHILKLVWLTCFDFSCFQKFSMLIFLYISRTFRVRRKMGSWKWNVIILVSKEIFVFNFCFPLGAQREDLITLFTLLPAADHNDTKTSNMHRAFIHTDTF